MAETDAGKVEMQPLQGDRRPMSHQSYSVNQYVKSPHQKNRVMSKLVKFNAGEPTRRRRDERVQRQVIGQNCCCTCCAEDADLDDDDLLDYQYSCCPPRLFMLLVSLAQIGMFVWYQVSGKQDNIHESKLIYDPYKRKEAWRFLSYSLLHGSYDHLIGNMIFQLFLGIFLELIFCWQVVFVYLVGVISGCLAHSVIQGNIMLVGASGGVYALVTAHVAKIIMNYSEMKEKGGLVPIFGGIFWFGLALVFFAEQMVSAFVFKTEGISYSAHLGGALCGFFLGCPVLNLNLDRGWERIFSVVCYIIFLLLVAGAVLFNIFHDYS